MKNNMIRTVTGDIKPEQLGRCLAHQHVIFGFPGWECCAIDPFDYDKELERCAAVLIDAKERFGLNSVIDATPGDCGRNAQFLKDVSERSGVYIIASTGYYSETSGACAHFRFRMGVGNAEEEVYRMMRHEFMEGIGDTGIKAGVIKVAASPGGITAYDDVFHRAAARLSREEDVPIITHCEVGQYYDQAKRLIEYGASPDRILIGHMNNCTDLEQLASALELGVWGGFDRCGIEITWGLPKESRQLGMICALADMGYGDRLVLAHDSWIRLLGDEWVYSPEDAQNLRNWNWVHVFENVIPELQKMGLSAELTEKMVRDNPAAFLG